MNPEVPQRIESLLETLERGAASGDETFRRRLLEVERMARATADLRSAGDVTCVRLLAEAREMTARGDVDRAEVYLRQAHRRCDVTPRRRATR